MSIIIIIAKCTIVVYLNYINISLSIIFFRENVKQLFECFCEIAAPVGEKPAWILQKYPNSFSDEEILKSVPKFTYPCEFEKYVDIIYSILYGYKFLYLLFITFFYYMLSF